jgi:mono/diheme cytochrome c family protein
MKIEMISVFVLSVMAGTAQAQAQALCKANPYTKQEAQLGKTAFDSKCALCHQYSMAGRVPGSSSTETPDIKLLSASDLEFLDRGGGSTPPLLGEKFFKKEQNKSVAEFSAFVSSAANTFPAANMKVPDTYFQIAAYILYRNCGGKL